MKQPREALAKLVAAIDQNTLLPYSRDPERLLKAIQAAREALASATPAQAEPVATVEMSMMPGKASPSWKPHKIIVERSLKWLDSVPVGTKLYVTPASQTPAEGASHSPWPEMHPATANLVRRFSWALADKLAAAEKKYGYSDGWLAPDWMDECRENLMRHIAKGDPRDVAAYCAFLWHHGEGTATTSRPYELNSDESAPEALWAEIWRLRGMATGPKGYTSWKDAATAERIRRADLEARLATTEQQAAALPRALTAREVDSVGNRWLATRSIDKHTADRELIAASIAKFCEVNAIGLATQAPEAAPQPIPEAGAGGMVNNLQLAVIGRAHFGNPIPKEWYAAARELLATQPPADRQAAPQPTPDLSELIAGAQSHIGHGAGLVSRLYNGERPTDTVLGDWMQYAMTYMQIAYQCASSEARPPISNAKWFEAWRASQPAPTLGVVQAVEPVAWITRGTLDGKKRLKEGECATNLAYVTLHKEWRWEPLYTHPEPQAGKGEAAPAAKGEKP